MLKKILKCLLTILILLTTMSFIGSYEKVSHDKDNKIISLGETNEF